MKTALKKLMNGINKLNGVYKYFLIGYLLLEIALFIRLLIAAFAGDLSLHKIGTFAIWTLITAGLLYYVKRKTKNFTRYGAFNDERVVRIREKSSMMGYLAMIMALTSIFTVSVVMIVNQDDYFLAHPDVVYSLAIASGATYVIGVLSAGITKLVLKKKM